MAQFDRRLQYTRAPPHINCMILTQRVLKGESESLLMTVPPFRLLINPVALVRNNRVGCVLSSWCARATLDRRCSYRFADVITCSSAWADKYWLHSGFPRLRASIHWFGRLSRIPASPPSSIDQSYCSLIFHSPRISLFMQSDLSSPGCLGQSYVSLRDVGT